ncbi:erythromycin esterase family protein [Nonomuraea sp. NPDC049684]|uniref:erythromycin esterase family protein n=1 Tax=Nonomuraea sp. NPDC049684 TaxID=3364356 RepID=UPI0037AA87D8
MEPYDGRQDPGVRAERTPELHPDRHRIRMGGEQRKRLDDRFVTVSTSSSQGGYDFSPSEAACPDDTKPAERPMTCKGWVPAAGPDYNEYVLDRVRYRDFLLDTRTAPRSARTWPAQARPTRLIGGGFWSPDHAVHAPPLSRSYDLVIHLHQVKAATLSR